MQIIKVGGEMYLGEFNATKLVITKARKCGTKGVSFKHYLIDKEMNELVTVQLSPAQGYTLVDMTPKNKVDLLIATETMKLAKETAMGGVIVNQFRTLMG